MLVCCGGSPRTFLVSTMVLTILLGADTLLLLVASEGAGIFLWLMCLGRFPFFAVACRDVLFVVGGGSVALSVDCPWPLVSQYLCCWLLGLFG